MVQRRRCLISLGGDQMHNLGKEVAIFKISDRLTSDFKLISQSDCHGLLKITQMCCLVANSKFAIDKVMATPESQFNTDGSIK